jgi:hypothetical protein
VAAWAFRRVLPIKAFCSDNDIDREVLDSILSFLQADPLEPYVAVLVDVPATLDVRFHRYQAMLQQFCVSALQSWAPCICCVLDMLQLRGAAVGPGYGYDRITRAQQKSTVNKQCG